MADTKTSALTALTGANAAAGDMDVVLDVSDTTQGAGGTLKNMTLPEKAKALGGAGGGITNPAYASAATDAAVANTETVIGSLTIPANEPLTGSLWKLEAWWTKSGTTSASPVIRVRMGPTTLTGAIIGTLTPPADTLAVDGHIEGLIVCRNAAGASTSMMASIKRQVHLAAVTIQPAIASQSGGTVVDTTVQNLMELTFISGNAANTFTFRNVAIYKIKT